MPWDNPRGMAENPTAAAVSFLWAKPDPAKLSESGGYLVPGMGDQGGRARIADPLQRLPRKQIPGRLFRRDAETRAEGGGRLRRG